MSNKKYSSSQSENHQSDEKATKTLNNHSVYILLIGPAGAGKTTISKRVALATFQQKRHCIFVPLAFLHPNEPTSLKYLLLNIPMMLFTSKVRLSEHDLDVAFKWLLANQNSITVIFDGLDQARIKLEGSEVTSGFNVNKKYKPSALIFLILSRNFLPDVRLILTSRPHSILNFHAQIQPDHVLYLDDLAEEDMRILMQFYTKSRDIDEIVAKLLENSPRVQQLTYCPLFLRIFCQLFELIGSVEIWKIIQSTASLFDELLRRLQQSSHNAGEIEDENIFAKIVNLAHAKTMSGSVVIDQNDLERFGIEAKDAQNLMIGIHGEANAALIGPCLFYFSHQSVQVGLKFKLN